VTTTVSLLNGNYTLGGNSTFSSTQSIKKAKLKPEYFKFVFGQQGDSVIYDGAAYNLETDATSSYYNDRSILVKVKEEHSGIGKIVTASSYEQLLSAKKYAVYVVAEGSDTHEGGWVDLDSLTIHKATPTVNDFSFTPAQDTVYDSKEHAFNSKKVPSWRRDDKTHGTVGNLRYVEASSPDTFATAAPKAVGVYAILADITGTNNFNAVSGLALDTLRITKRPITVDSVLISAKTYDGTDTARVTKVVKFGDLAGIASGALTLNTDYAIDSARFEDTQAGEDKDVHVYVRLTGGRSVNYELSNSVYTQKHSVAQKKITLKSAVIASKTYDGTDTAKVSSVEFSNLVNGATTLPETDYSVVNAYFTDKNAGESKRTAKVRVALEGDAAVNYELTRDSCQVTKQTIAKATLTKEHLNVTGNSIALADVVSEKVTVALKDLYTGAGKVAVSYLSLDGTALGFTVNGKTLGSAFGEGKFLIVATIAAGTNFLAFEGVVDTLTVGGTASPLGSGSTNKIGQPPVATFVLSALNAIAVSNAGSGEWSEVAVEGDTIYYAVPCGSDASSLQVVFDKTAANITSGVGDTLTVDVSKAALIDVSLPFTFTDGQVKTYTLRVERLFEFSSIVHVQLGGKMLLVVKNPEINGGYNFESAMWERKLGDVWVSIASSGSSFYYASSDPITDTVRVWLKEENGVWLQTCPYDSVFVTPAEGLQGAGIYPNPVASGATVTLQLDAAGSYTAADLEQIYTAVYVVNITGNRMFTGKFADLQAGLSMPYVSGTYFIVLEGKSARKVFKVTVQ
jgi:hypothetical protein